MYLQNKKKWVISIIIFFALTIYFGIVDQGLVYHYTQPFFTGSPDWTKVISNPGFLTYHFSHFIFQFFYSNIAGSMLLTLLIMLWCLCLYFILSRYFEFHLFAFPVLLSTLPFVTAHSLYNYPFHITFSIFLSAVIVLIYDSISKNSYYHNLIIHVILSFITYVVSGIAGFLIFISLTIALLVIKKKSRLIPAHLIIGLLIPVVFSIASDTLPLKFAFSGNLGVDNIPVLIYLMPGILFFVFLLPGKKENKKLIRLIANPVMLIVLFATTMYFSFQKEEKHTIKVDKLAYEQKWDDIIEFTKNDSDPDLLTQFNINRALYHTGLLLEKMFEYPQIPGPDGLQPERKYSSEQIEIQTSDLYFEMGFLNGAIHWANEAYMMSGNKPRIVQRLAEIYLISHEYSVAEKFINLLEKSIVTRKQAKKYRQYLYCDSCVLSNPEYRKFYLSIPSENFYASSRTPEFNLMKLSQSSEMAFQYLMAFYLMVNDIHAADSLSSEFRKFGYRTIPTVCEEARLLYYVKKGLPVKSDDFQPKTVRDFQNFDKVLFTNHNGNLLAAKNDLQPFKNTYWYYYLYHSASENKMANSKE